MSLTSSPKILLQRLGLRPKKTLGQNFLVHPHQARRIVDALEFGGDETVVEIVLFSTVLPGQLPVC